MITRFLPTNMVSSVAGFFLVLTFNINLLILFYTTSANRKLILVFINHLVWNLFKLFLYELCRTGRDPCEVKFTGLYHWKTKLLDVLFAFDMKFTLSARKNYQQKKTKKNVSSPTR